ncbi:MAG: malto-oligosyltrehalose trehalohydrolase [Bacteroidetes bacterium]|nr:malto-oligosyltrehalose trehalohydrolase [Bacteroidota bacterium]
MGAWYSPAATEFTVWAPLLQKVELQLPDGLHPMTKDDQGYWKISISVSPGTQYRFRLDGEVICPDPASFSQPEGVHGSSAVLDRHFAWTDGDWKGIPLSNKIIYELHTGTFSSTHDFEGIERRLDYLAGLGINTIELMPLGQFPGDRNWGYDGVYPFAVQHSYGGAKAFQQLVDAAHARGIAVIVDVVYNHLGPEGNYLEAFAPYFTDVYKTPWGKSLNFDGPWSDGVRNYFLQNARMWLEDYHVDALRVDAVHAIRDFSAIHFIQQLKELALEIERRCNCKKELIAEIDLNDPRYINPVSKGGYGLDGQWIDEFHHSLRALMTGETNAYYEDFGQIAQLEKAFRSTYVYDGVYSPHRKRTFGARADGNSYDQFVVFAQNHDQVGNRAIGDRLTNHLNFEQLKLAAATVLLSPYVPMLFMGEEYGERNPFPFFGNFGDTELIEAVRKGRAAEFKAFHSDIEIPDPMASETFESAVLSWKVGEEPGSTLLAFYRQLIQFRQTRPALQGRTRDTMIVHPPTGDTLPFERKIINDHLFIWLHFGSRPVSLDNITGRYLGKVFDTADTQWKGPGTGPQYDISPGQPILIAPHSAVVFEKK